MPTKNMPSATSFVAHRLDDAALDVTDLERDRATSRADVGPRVVARGHPPEGGRLPVALEDLALEQEDPGIAVLAAVDELLDDRVAVLQHGLGHLREVRLVSSSIMNTLRPLAPYSGLTTEWPTSRTNRSIASGSRVTSERGRIFSGNSSR